MTLLPHRRKKKRRKKREREERRPRGWAGGADTSPPAWCRSSTVSHETRGSATPCPAPFSPHIFCLCPTDAVGQEREQRAREAARRRALSSSVIRELQEELSEAPQELGGAGGAFPPPRAARLRSAGLGGLTWGADSGRVVGQEAGLGLPDSCPEGGAGC